MTRRYCARESDVWDAIAGGRWPPAPGGSLLEHVRSCRSCGDLVAVSVALAADAASARATTTVPSAAVVWWRAQVRARQEAARAATRPITVVQGLAIACSAGIALGIAGFAGAWLRGVTSSLLGWSLSAASAAADAGVADVASRWVLVPLVLLVATAVLAPVAVYLITAED